MNTNNSPSVNIPQQPVVTIPSMSVVNLPIPPPPPPPPSNQPIQSQPPPTQQVISQPPVYSPPPVYYAPQPSPVYSPVSSNSASSNLTAGQIAMIVIVGIVILSFVGVSIYYMFKSIFLFIEKKR